MKRLLLSMTVLLAFGMTSKAQGISLPGLPDACSPDLTISGYNIPTSAPASGPITFTFTVKNSSECSVPAHKAAFYIGNSVSAPGNDEFFDVLIPAMSALTTYRTVTVEYTPLHPTSGTTYWIHWIDADAYNTVPESNENNNLNTSMYPIVITLY